jgi:hypothetical protein
MPQIEKIYTTNVQEDYANGKQHIEVLDTDPSVVAGTLTGTTTANSIIGNAKIVVPAGGRVQIKRVLMTAEGTGAAHFDLFLSGVGVIEPMGYLPASGQLERVGTFKDPVTVFVNTSTTSSATIGISVASPISAVTYTASIRYSLMDDTRPSI